MRSNPPPRRTDTSKTVGPQQLLEQLQFEFMQQIPAAIDASQIQTENDRRSVQRISSGRSRAIKPAQGYSPALVPDELLLEVQQSGWTCWMVHHRRRRFTTRCKAFLLHWFAAIKNRLHV
jgi:hypothetical protein